MNYKLVLTNKFKKGLKLAKRRGLDIRLAKIMGGKNQFILTSHSTCH